jgi:hypothetical protein
MKITKHNIGNVIETYLKKKKITYTISNVEFLTTITIA